MRMSRPAFTLVEVLATMTLLSIVLPSMMRGLSACQLIAGEAAARSEAASLAQWKLHELCLGEQWRQSASSGEFGAEHPRFRWEAELVDWQEDSALKELTVTVSWKRGTRDRRLALTTLVRSAETLGATGAEGGG